MLIHRALWCYISDCNFPLKIPVYCLQDTCARTQRCAQKHAMWGWGSATLQICWPWVFFWLLPWLLPCPYTIYLQMLHVCNTSVTGKSWVYTAAEFACGARPSPTAQPSHPQTWELQGSAQPCAFYSRDQYVLLTSVWHLRKQEEIPWNLSPFSCLTRPSMTYWWFAADYKMFPGVGHQSVVHPVHCTVESREESWNLTEAEGLSYIAKLQVRWRSKQARFHTTWPSQVVCFFFSCLKTSIYHSNVDK